MTEEDEAFEELSRKQGYWGLQGSRKHQILRYAENVEIRTGMTQDEIIEMAVQAGMAKEIAEVNIDIVEAFAKLVAEKEREACAKFVDHILKEGGGTWGDSIRARGQA